MISFIFLDILMIAFGAVLYLVVQALPRIVDDPDEKKNFLERWGYSELPEKVDASVNNFLSKFLRKTKVNVLKLDNSLSKQLDKVNSKKKKGEKVIDFSDITGAPTESDEEPAEKKSEKKG